MGKSRILCCLFLVLLVHSVSYAYFHTYEQNDNLTITSTEKSLPIKTGSLVYHYYDNHITSENDDYLSRKIDGYIAAGKIEPTLPLVMRLGNSLSLEKNIDQITLIVLKIQQLLSEYNELKERIKKVTLDENLLVNSDAQEKANLSVSYLQEQRADLLERIHNLNQLTVQSPLTKPDSINLRTITHTGSGDQKWYKNNYDSSMDSGGSGGGSRAGKRRSSSGSTAELPWVFKVLLKVLAYMNENKLEIAIYLSVFVAGIVGIISVSGRR